jgi:hypothetical protein
MRVSTLTVSSSPTAIVVVPRSGAYWVESPIGSSNDELDAAPALAGNSAKTAAMTTTAMRTDPSPRIRPSRNLSGDAILVGRRMIDQSFLIGGLYN